MVLTCWVVCCARPGQRCDGHGLVEAYHRNAACSNGSCSPSTSLALVKNEIIESMMRRLRLELPVLTSDQYMSDVKSYLASVSSLQADFVWVLRTLHFISQFVHQQIGHRRFRPCFNGEFIDLVSRPADTGIAATETGGHEFVHEGRFYLRSPSVPSVRFVQHPQQLVSHSERSRWFVTTTHSFTCYPAHRKP